MPVCTVMNLPITGKEQEKIERIAFSKTEHLVS